MHLIASNTACSPLLGQHHLLPLATYVEAGTLGGVTAELLPPTSGPMNTSTHGERGHRVTSHLDSTVYLFSRRTGTEEMAEHSMTRTAGRRAVLGR